MPTRRENPQVRKLIASLRKKKEEFYTDIARHVSKPSRMGTGVNITKIAKFDDDVVVPGTVLGDGKIEKAGNIYALRFSKNARSKIENAGGKCMSIEKLLESNKKARIVV